MRRPTRRRSTPRGRIVLWWRRTRAVAPEDRSPTSTTRASSRSRSPTRSTRPTARPPKQAMKKAGVWAGAAAASWSTARTCSRRSSSRSRATPTSAIVALSLAVVADGNYHARSTTRCTSRSIRRWSCAEGDPERTPDAARSFTAFVNSPEGRAIMKKYGFLLPGETNTACREVTSTRGQRLGSRSLLSFQVAFVATLLATAVGVLIGLAAHFERAVPRPRSHRRHHHGADGPAADGARLLRARRARPQQRHRARLRGGRSARSIVFTRTGAVVAATRRRLAARRQVGARRARGRRPDAAPRRAHARRRAGARVLHRAAAARRARHRRRRSCSRSRARSATSA